MSNLLCGRPLTFGDREQITELRQMEKRLLQVDERLDVEDEEDEEL